MPQSMQRFLDLNVSREKELQNIASLAAETCQTPVAILRISEQGKVTQRYKAGMIAAQIPDKNSFLDLPLTANQVTVIPDAARDSRTASMPLVAGPTGIRFFAGIPLITHDDKCIGTLCVMGREPKELSQRRKGMLQMLANQAVHMVEFEHSLRALKQQLVESKNSENKLRSFFESSKSSHVLLNRNLEVITYNKSFYDAIKMMLGIKVRAGMKANECIIPAYVDDFTKHAQIALAGKSVQHERVLEPKGLPPIWARISYNPAFDGEGNIIGVSFNATDITQRKLSEQQILKQNEALRKIAFMQSHELRKPVANILGLMDLIKMKGYSADPDLLHLMEKTVLELDNTIHDIVKTADNYPDGTLLNPAYPSETQEDLD